MKPSKRKSKCIKLFIVLFIVGIVISVLYFNNLEKEEINILLDSVKSSNIIYKPINNITNHLKILSVISLFSIIFIGLPICAGLIISEGFSFTFRLLLLYKLYKFKGLTYSIIYYLVGNLIYIYLLYIIFKRICLICKKIYKLKIKNESFNYTEIYNLLIKVIYIIIIILISDILIYFYGDNILKIFAFLTK